MKNTIITLSLLVAMAGVAQADLMKFITKAEAERAAKRIPVGGALVHWVSQNSRGSVGRRVRRRAGGALVHWVSKNRPNQHSGQPTLYVVESVEVINVREAFHLVRTKVRAIAVRGSSGWRPLDSETVVVRDLDLAYTYLPHGVARRGSARRFRNLAKAMSLVASVKHEFVAVAPGPLEAAWEEGDEILERARTANGRSLIAGLGRDRANVAKPKTRSKPDQGYDRSVTEMRAQPVRLQDGNSVLLPRKPIVNLPLGE